MEVLENLMVSVNMITYGHENYIRQAIEGVLMQETNFEFDLIIADDCSPDNTQKIVEEIIERHPKGYRIKYFRHKQNIGMNANSMFAFEQCKGKYIAICEGDDYWTDPLKLQKQVDFLEGNSDYSFCVHRYKLYLENKKEFESEIYPINFSNYLKNGVVVIDNNFFKDWLTQPLTAVIVKDDLIEVLNKHIHFEYFRDYHIFYFLLQRGKGACLDLCSGVYRINDGGIASGKTTFEKIKIGFLIFEELFLYSKNNMFLFNYWKYAFVLIRQLDGAKVVLKSFGRNFVFRDKLMSIWFLLVAISDSISIKFKRI